MAELKQTSDDILKTLTSEEKIIYGKRFQKRFDEIKRLYTEMYNNSTMFSELCEAMELYYAMRPAELKKMDMARESDPAWYKSQKMVGMMLYIDKFADNIKGVQRKLAYLEKAGINYIHLMPFLDTPQGKSYGGYAVKDFRKVRPDLGNMKDLDVLTSACRKKNINLCMDFVMNHTSDEHIWAIRARRGESEFMNRYLIYDNPVIPRMFDDTVPQIFPTTAPGNFSYIPEIDHYVMTSFHHDEWDLNYANPRVFNEMIYNFLFLTNRGIDVMRLDALPYIWKELGTRCYDNPQVHTLVRMIRIISEIVCPGVVLLAEVVNEPDKVVHYFGTAEKPECHMLYDATNMAITWHTLATRNCKLLKKHLDMVNGIPKDYTFINYLRNHDAIGWRLDYQTLAEDGINEKDHKQYLNDYFRGFTDNSNSRGDLYNDDPKAKPSRICGTTASLSGIERAGFEGNEPMMEQSIKVDILLHSYLFMRTGMPIIYSGDEIGATNDYSYKDDPEKQDDCRCLHRGRMNWENAGKVDNEDTVEGKIFSALCKLEEIRKNHRAYSPYADTWTMETWDAGTLAMGRYYDGEKIIGVFNFTEDDRVAWINEDDGDYVDLISGNTMKASGVQVPAYSFCLLKKDFNEEQ